MTPTVLIADPDWKAREVLSQILLHRGFRVRVAESGLQCLECLRARQPDLLILDADLVWGGPDGVLAVMRDDPELRTIPVVVTQPSQRIARDDLLAPPVIHVLTKPFTVATLLECLAPFDRGSNRRGAEFRSLDNRVISGWWNHEAG